MKHNILRSFVFGIVLLALSSITSFAGGDVLGGEGGGLGSLKVRDGWHAYKLEDLEPGETLFEKHGFTPEMRIQLIGLAMSGDFDYVPNGYNETEWREFIMGDTAIQTLMTKAHFAGNVGSPEMPLREMVRFLTKAVGGDFRYPYEMESLFYYEVFINHILQGAKNREISGSSIQDAIALLFEGLDYKGFLVRKTDLNISMYDCGDAFRMFSERGFPDEEYVAVREICGFLQLGIRLYPRIY